MSKLLLDEHPLLIMPQLAVKIGLNEAIVLQQIHYWVQINEKAKINYKDGYYWTYNTYEEWQKQFPFWSNATIRRAINSLQKLLILVCGNYNKLQIDRTKWYRIDHEVLMKLEEMPCAQIEQFKCSNRAVQEVILSRPLPETTPKTTPKITARIEGKPNGITSLSPVDNFMNVYSGIKDLCYKREVMDIFMHYFGTYQQVVGKQHSIYKHAYTLKAIRKIEDLFLTGIFNPVTNKSIVLDPRTITEMIDKHFATQYKKMDYKLLGFLSEEVLKNRYFEVQHDKMKEVAEE